jgi:probable HAF family extracellular repeat protein
MNPARAGRFLLALSCMAAILSHAAQPSRWTLIDLGDLAGGAGGSTALAINDHGAVVGSATAPAAGGFGFALHAFLWEDGVMRDLGTPPTSTMSGAIDVNDRGAVLAGDGLGGQYLWQDGNWVRLSVPGVVDRINKFGDMAGSYAVAGRTHVYLLERGTVLQDGGTLGGSFASPEGMNDRGAIVGRSSLAGETEIHAFKYADGTLSDLGTLGGTFSTGIGINKHGVVVGASLDANRNAYAFVHDGTSMRRLLPNLPAPQTATAINDHGAIVGDLGQNGSYLYDDGDVTLLESIPEVQAGGWARLIPTGINNRGWITGWGIRPGRSDRAFVLIPR